MKPTMKPSRAPSATVAHEGTCCVNRCFHLDGANLSSCLGTTWHQASCSLLVEAVLSQHKSGQAHPLQPKHRTEMFSRLLLVLPRKPCAADCHTVGDLLEGSIRIVSQCLPTPDAGSPSPHQMYEACLYPCAVHVHQTWQLGEQIQLSVGENDNR